MPSSHPSVSGASVSGAAPLITSRIDEASRVSLPGNLRPEATAANDLGPVDDSLPLEHIQLLLRRPAARQAALDAYLAQLSDRRSPSFHHWLTPEALGEQFGLAESDLATITNWLESHGMTVNTVYPNRLTIDFSATAAQARSAFSVQIHAYQVNGIRHIANADNPSIPAALAPAIVGVVSLHDFAPRSMVRSRAEFTSGQGAGAVEYVTPADLATIYNLGSAFRAGYTGQGVVIAIVGVSNVYSTADWSTFRSRLGLSSYTTGSFTQIHPAPGRGGSNCANPGLVEGWENEPIIDAEYASAAAPGAAIELASCASTKATFGGLIALENLLDGGTLPAAISISYSECEAANGAAANAAYNAAYEQAAAEGVSVFVAAGDQGAASCDAGQSSALHGLGVNAYASTPYNVAVGGTDFEDTYLRIAGTYWNTSNSSVGGSAKSYIPEIPWNDSCAGQLLAGYEGYSTPFGANGFCNSRVGQEAYQKLVAGGAGQSACATGNPSVANQVSGSCRGYAKPEWQSILGNPNDGFRDLPDVSLFAGDGVWNHAYLYCYSNYNDPNGAPCGSSLADWSLGGGTSFAAPIMAGIQALVDQRVGRSGNPNPTYYAIAEAEYAIDGSAVCKSSKGNQIGQGCVFQDIAAGDNDVDCRGSVNCYLPSGSVGGLTTVRGADSPAYTAGIGWDFATGIGSVNAYNLVISKNWEPERAPYR